MIHYVTSAHRPLCDVTRQARRLVRELQRPPAVPLVFYNRLPVAPHSMEGEQGDMLIAQHEEHPGAHILGVSLAELPLLRLLRRVREGRLQVSDLRVTALDRHGEAFCPRVGPDGEFLDPWRDGFFDGRMQELF